MPKDNIWEWDATASNNTDVGGVSTAEGQLPGLLNNAIRELMSQASELCRQGSDIASASTCNIAATGTSFYVHVTGTTTITSFGTANAGVWRWVTFTGALTLTHNATSLIIPGGANYTTAAGTMIFAVSEGSGNWRVRIFPASGASVANASTTVQGSVRYATDAEFLAQTEADAALTPSNLAVKPTFMANKNASAQGSITGGDAADVKVTFGTEEWDIGSYFASSTWTPPAGKFRITASIEWGGTNGVDNEILYTKLYKNGSEHRIIANKRNGTGGEGFNNSFIVDADGNDTFEIYVRKAGAGDGAINGAITSTWLCGEMI
jgi:hypothetical protein